MAAFLSPIPPSPMHRRHAQAACVLQRAARNRAARASGRDMLSLWPSLAQLRALYLDEAALKAGAKDSSLYADEVIVQREALRNHPRVVAALQYFWDSIPRRSPHALSKSEYLVIARKLYLITVLEQGGRGSTSLDAQAWQADAERDFLVDGKNKDHLTLTDFNSAFFQMADLHTNDVSSSSYAGWLRRKSQQMTSAFSGEGAKVLSGAGMRVREWRDDAEIIALSSIHPEDRLELERDACNELGSPTLARHLARKAALPPMQGSAAAHVLPGQRRPSGDFASMAKGSSMRRAGANVPLQATAHAAAGGAPVSARSSHSTAGTSKRGGGPVVDVVERLRWFGAYAERQKLEAEHVRETAKEQLHSVAEKERERRARARRLSKEVLHGGVEDAGRLAGKALMGALLRRDRPAAAMAAAPKGQAARGLPRIQSDSVLTPMRAATLNRQHETQVPARSEAMMQLAERMSLAGLDY